MSIPHRDLDVRPILRAGGEPFSVIMEAVEALKPGQSLRLLATFKPIPLFQVLGARGFTPSAREIGNGDWEVIFAPSGSAEPHEISEPQTLQPSGADAWPPPTIELDNRDLDPPEPLVRTLEGVEQLPPGETLVALLPREPLFLFDELKARGYSWRGSLELDGSYRIVIHADGPGKKSP
jgi:uncharacterized protein (DUF2249 family)